MSALPFGFNSSIDDKNLLWSTTFININSQSSETPTFLFFGIKTQAHNLQDMK